jgi:hypothetical protein
MRNHQLVSAVNRAIQSRRAVRASRLLLAGAFVVSANAAHATVAEDAVFQTEVISTNSTEIVIAHAEAPTPPNAPTPPSPPVRIQKFESFGGPSGQDIDVIVSSAISQAFTSLDGKAMLGSKTVKNAPYSAEIINERVQTLPDGNQIVKRTSQMAYRDSAGRTRTEVRDENGELRTITIFDAVEGSRLVLNPKTKSATKINIDRDLAKHIEAVREKAKAAMKDGKATIIERGGPGEEIIIHRSEGGSPHGGQEVREEVNVKVIRGEGAAVSDARVKSATTAITLNGPGGQMSLQSLGGELGDKLAPLGNLFQDRKWATKATTKELGTRDFDGVRAEGKLRSYVIPAGEIGNRNAITVSTETWTSPDLQMTVYSKHSDPRVGDTIYRLANVKRSEPTLALFAAPDGYTVKEAPSISFKAK